VKKHWVFLCLSALVVALSARLAPVTNVTPAFAGGVVGSPAIDAGQIPFCSDGTGARCDIGAVEAGPYLYLPLVLR
jgi:hypothetical protein